MPDDPATEPLQTVTSPDGPTLALTAAEAELYHHMISDLGARPPEGTATTVVRTLVELGALRHRLEARTEKLGEPDVADIDPRTTIDGMLREVLAGQDRASDAAAEQVRDLALALAALGGPPTITVKNDPEPLKIAARELVAVMARFTADDFAGRLEDLVAPLNAIELALELQA